MKPSNTGQQPRTKMTLTGIVKRHKELSWKTIVVILFTYKKLVHKRYIGIIENHPPLIYIINMKINQLIIVVPFQLEHQQDIRVCTQIYKIFCT